MHGELTSYNNFPLNSVVVVAILSTRTVLLLYPVYTPVSVRGYTSCTNKNSSMLLIAILYVNNDSLLCHSCSSHLLRTAANREHGITLHNNALLHKKCLREKTTTCSSLFVFFRIRCGTFPYSGGDDANTTKPTTNHT